MSTKLAAISGGKTSAEGLFRLMSTLFPNSGVISGMQVAANGTPDNTIKIPLGDIAIGNNNPSASSYYFHGWVTVQESLTIAANASGNPRIDAIVAYIDLSAPSNTTDNPAVLKFMSVAGTPAGSPSAPSGATIQAAVGASNPYYILADVAVANNFTTITTGNITNLSKASQGFTAFTPVWTSTGATPSIGNGQLYGKYIKIGKMVTYSGFLRYGSTTATGTGQWLFSLPFPAKDGLLDIGSAFMQHYNSSNWCGICLTYDQTTMQINGWNEPVEVGQSIPFAWGNLDILAFTFTYEAA